jgi:imidazoleglycerol phosphate synthase glutamine amidotransferase subunit HisH
MLPDDCPVHNRTCLLINTVHNGESFYADFSFRVQHLSSEEIPLHVQYLYAHYWTEFTAASTDQLDIRLSIASFVVEKSANVGNKLTAYKISQYVLGVFFI